MKHDEGESPEAFRNRCLHRRTQHERGPQELEAAMFGQFTGDTLCLDCGMLFTRQANVAEHYKHYLLKALEALKAEHQKVKEMDGCEGRECATCDTIAELEEVKT